MPPDQVRDNSRPDCLPAPVLAFEPVQHPRGTPSESGYPLGPDRPAAGELGAAGAKLRGRRQAHRRTGRTHCTSPRLRIPATGFTRPGGSIATSRGGIYTFPAVRGRPAEAMGHSPSSNRTVGSTTSIEPRSRAATGGTFTADFGRRGRWHGYGLGTSRGPSRGGITAAGFSNQAGVIRVSEMRAGVINHALFMTVNCHHGNVWPANNVGTHGHVLLERTPRRWASISGST